MFHIVPVLRLRCGGVSRAVDPEARGLSPGVMSRCEDNEKKQGRDENRGFSTALAFGGWTLLC